MTRNGCVAIDKDTSEYECYLKQPIESTKNRRIHK